MLILGFALSLVLIFGVLIDSFETVVVPRRVIHRYRFARFYFRTGWAIWRVAATWVPAGKRREALLSWFGPLSLLGLFAAWMLGLIFGFALLQWSLDTPPKTATEETINFVTYLYMSGTTFFTLGYGDVTPVGFLGRFIAVVESGTGFGFLAAVIAYLPVIHQAASRREATIALLDARAGSPPSAGQFLLRLTRAGNILSVDPFLAEWERWSAELLESHLSFPLLSFYRSQHDNQSWIAALTTILDTCAFLIVGSRGNQAYQAQLTFAMARHAAVDLSLVLNAEARSPDVDRLPVEKLCALHQQLKIAGLDLDEDAICDARLRDLRALYEPFVEALARRLLFALPPIVPETVTADNWQRSPGMPRTPGIGRLPSPGDGEEHFG